MSSFQERTSIWGLKADQLARVDPNLLDYVMFFYENNHRYEFAHIHEGAHESEYRTIRFDVRKFILNE